MKVTLNRRMRLGGRMYATGDAASLARHHARVLIATGRAKAFVAEAPAPAAAPPVVQPVAQEPPVSVEHASEPERIHHDFHQPSTARTAEASKAGSKAPAAKKAPSGQKVDK